MYRFRNLCMTLLTSGMVLGSAASWGATTTGNTLPENPPAPHELPTQPDASEAAPQLSPAMLQLRDRMRGVLSARCWQSFNTRDNTPAQILSLCLAFGCNAEVWSESQSGKRLNAITCLCWNYPCSGYRLLGYSGEHIAARVGHGCQHVPGEFLATLALARVPASYPVRVDKDVRSVADLVEAEKLDCREGQAMSLKLVGLAFYVHDDSWQSESGEVWSLARMVDLELDRPAPTTLEGDMERLLGLTCAVLRRAKDGAEMDGPFARAEKFLIQRQKHALQTQSAEGFWGPQYPFGPNTTTDAASQLRTTGRVLEWLVLSLPQEELRDARAVKAVDYLTRLLEARCRQGNIAWLSTQEIDVVGHALHALSLYDERMFKPSDVKEPEAAAQTPPVSR